jgi:hypothetical protein
MHAASRARLNEALDGDVDRMIPHDPKTISTARAIVMLVFSPSTLIGHAVDHAIRSQEEPLDTAREVKLRGDFEAQFKRSVSTIRSTLFSSFVVVAGSVAAAFVSGAILQALSIIKSSGWNIGLQVIGIGVLLWATLARVDPTAIQTWDGGTLPERVDLWLYRFLYIIGSYALTLSLIW